MSMTEKEGAIGRGRGVPSKEMLDLGASTITEQVRAGPGAGSVSIVLTEDPQVDGLVAWHNFVNFGQGLVWCNEMD